MTDPPASTYGAQRAHGTLRALRAAILFVLLCVALLQAVMDVILAHAADGSRARER